MEAHRKRRKLMGEINVVPFIDVMLVLLIVFMITSPLITQGVKVDLPQVNSKPTESNDEASLVVSIDAAGSYFITLGAVSEEDPDPVALALIADNVSKIMAANPTVAVFLEADASNNYGVVMSLMSTLEGAGVDNLLLITQPPK